MEKLAAEVVGKKRSGTRKKVAVLKNEKTVVGSNGESDHEMHIWTEREEKENEEYVLFPT